jgi:hypothetical protein
VTVVLAKLFFRVCHLYGGFPTDYIPNVFDGYVPTLRVGGQQIHLLLWNTKLEEEYKNIVSFVTLGLMLAAFILSHIFPIIQQYPQYLQGHSKVVSISGQASS